MGVRTTGWLLAVSGALVLGGAGPAAAQEEGVQGADRILRALDQYTGHWRTGEKSGSQGDLFLPVDGDAFESRTYLRQTPEDEWRQIGEDRWRASAPAVGAEPGGLEAGAESVGQGRRAVLDAMADLSATTGPGGGGPDAYAALLADDFTRWTVGNDTVMDKRSWVDGVRGWWDDGWRVADRQVQGLRLDVRGDHAFVRRVVREAYVGPDGEQTGPGSSVALAEVWERQGGRWLLLRVTAVSLDDR